MCLAPALLAVFVKGASAGDLIFTAAAQGWIERLQQRIAAGSDINARDSYSRYTPLHLAVKNGQVDAVRVLVKAGAQIDRRVSNYGSSDRSHFSPELGPAIQFTPLHLACYLRQPEIVQILLNGGADPNAILLHSGDQRPAVSSHGRTPLMLFLGDSSHLYWPDQVWQLFEYNKWYKRILSELTSRIKAEKNFEKEAERIFKEMIVGFANEVQREAAALSARQAVARAVQPAETDIAPMLIAAGAEVAMRDAGGLSAFEYAADNHKFGELAYLLGHRHDASTTGRLQEHLAKKSKGVAAMTHPDGAQRALAFRPPEQRIVSKHVYLQPHLKTEMIAIHEVSVNLSALITWHFASGARGRNQTSPQQGTVVDDPIQ
jgi:hypothetical protein